MARDRIRRAALASLALAACGAEPRGPAEEAGTADRPDRIVSLIPAATEILFALGAGERLVGRTRWGVHPPEARGVTDVGDGMRPSLEAVVAREPDLVVVYAGAGNAGVAERLASLGIATLTLRHDTLDDLERSIDALGRATGCVDGARRLAEWVSTGLGDVARATSGLPRARVYYDAWADPPITIGRGSFLDSLLTLAGAENIFGDLPDPGPRVSLESILSRDPEWIVTTAAGDSLVMDPGIAGRPGWDRLAAVRRGRVAVVDRDLVGRLGPRTPEAARRLAEAIHPGLSIREPDRWEPRCTG